MNLWIVIALILFVAYLVVVFALKVTAVAIHLMLVAAVVCLLLWIFRRRRTV
ncbi:MAG: hypothetical protein JO317_06980 [Verrucomicrobiae bacterium]|nr:hypothetical protein [Verrucomicrobiae bacterium]